MALRNTVKITRHCSSVASCGGTSALALTWCAASAFACSDEVAVVGRFDAREALEDAGQAPAHDAQTASAGDGAVSERCQIDKRAARAFGRALCACNDLRLATTGLHTDSFDSRDPDAGALLYGADVGSNGSFTTTLLALTIGVGGDFTVVRELALLDGTALSVAGDLRVGGTLHCESGVDVAGDVSLAGDLSGAGALRVGGDFTQTQGAARSSTEISVAGRELREPVAVVPPCACADDQILDVAALVTDATRRNDNATTGFDADALAAVVWAASVELPEGRSFASSINSAGSVMLRVAGRSSLFVEGSVFVNGSLLVTIAPEGRLDLFVGGDLSIAAIDGVGMANRPTQLRIYAARERLVSLAFLQPMVGLLYAPEADVVASATNELYGAILARNLDLTIDFKVHYDRSIVPELDDCRSPDR